MHALFDLYFILKRRITLLECELPLHNHVISAVILAVLYGTFLCAFDGEVDWLWCWFVLMFRFYTWSSFFHPVS
jgi:hypothetical protein